MLRVLPYRQLAEEIAGRFAAERTGLDALAPWREEVVVPSRGVAESITAALLKRFPGGIAGLRIHSLENLARRIVNVAGETPRVASPEERRLAMRTVARSLGEPLSESRGAAAMLERSYRDLRDSGLPVSGLAKKIAGQRRLRDPRRSDAAVRAWQEYERLVAKLGAIDPADLLFRAAQLAGPATPPQLVAGFYDMTGAQLALVRALQDAGRIGGIWVPASGDFAKPLLDALGGSPTSPTSPTHPTRPNLHRYDTRSDEIAGVCAEAGALLAQGVAPQSIAITARALDPYDIHLINRFAAEHGFSTTQAEEIPLRAHRIGRGAATLLRLRERGFPRTDVLELVRDGLRCRTPLRVDAVDAATRRARVAGGTSAELTSLAGRPGPIADYLALVAELEAWTADLPELLSRVAESFRIETEHDLEAASALDEVAVLFRRASVWGQPFDLPSVIDAIEQRTISAPPLRPASNPVPCVWAGDVMRLRGRSFAHLFVLKAEDDLFPQRRLEDPLLPDSDRRLLGIREIGDGAAEERLLFSLLVEAGEETVHFSRAGGDGFGKVLRPSRFVRGIADATAAAGAGAHADANPVADAHAGTTAAREGTPPNPAPGSAREQKAADEPRPRRRPLQPEDHPNLPRQLQLLVKRGRRGVFDGIIGPLPPPFASKVESLSPTQLEEFGECPQKFFLKHLLGARDLDQPERELQIHHREKGTLDHRVLERFYRQMPPDQIEAAIAALPRLPDPTIALLERLIDEQFADLEAQLPAFNTTVRAIERRATKRILGEFVVRDLADLAASGLRPRYFEYRFGSKHREEADHPEPFLVRSGEATVRVEGTIDRIDAGEARLRIVDYKSGRANRHKDLDDKIDRGIRLQLALYALAATGIFGLEPEAVSGVIKPLAGENRNLGFELSEKREALLQTLAGFVDAIRSGTFPAYPDEDGDVGSCRYCPANHSCRTLHEPEEYNGARRHRDARALLEHWRTDGGGEAS